MSLTISAARVVAAGETLSFQSTMPGLILQGSGYAVTIDGTVDVADVPTSTTGLPLIGIDYNSSGSAAPTITISATGLVDVHATEGTHSAVGVSGNQPNDFTNRGTFQVSSVGGSASGISTSQPAFDFVNSGVFRVTSSHGDASGVAMTNGSSVNNSGTIEVTGAGNIFGISASSFGGVFVNSGTITVTSTGFGATELVGVNWANGTFTNSGTINGLVTGGPSTVLNTGRLGGLRLDSGATNVTNNNQILGTVDLGAGNDTYSGTGSVGSGGVRGGDGSDLLTGRNGTDSLFGDAGSDTIEGNGGADNLDGGAGIDLLSFEHSSVGVSAGIVGSNAFNFEAVLGSAFNDTLSGAVGDDTLGGGAGADRLDGGAGDDTLSGGAGGDTLSGSTGKDRFLIGSGESGVDVNSIDVLTDWTSDETLVFAGGSVAGATYAESTAASYSAARTYADAAIGGGQANFVAVAVGADTYVFVDSANNNGAADDAVLLLGRGLADIDAANFVAGAAPPSSPPPPPPTTTRPPQPVLPTPTSATGSIGGNMDTLNLDVVGTVTDASSSLLRLAAPGLTLTTTGTGFVYNSAGDLIGGTVLTFSIVATGLQPFSFNIDLNPSAPRSASTLVDNSAASIFSTFLSGADNLIGGNGADLIRGYASSDLISGSGGNNSLYGGLGNDVLYGYGPGGLGAPGANYLRGEEGDDYIVGGEAFDDAHGNMGNDTVSGGGFDDWVVGGQGNDLLFGDDGGDLCYGQLGNDTVNGGAGNDAVVGGQANDILNGGEGDDFVTGDRGDDTITGGLGADTFHTNNVSGIDRVTDFSAAEGDRVLVDVGSAYTLVQVGADTIIDMGGGNQMILVGVALSSLPSGWITGG